MKNVALKEYGQIFSEKEDGDKLYEQIKKLLNQSDEIIYLNFDGVISMATFCAKQVFGRLYIEQGAEEFFKRIKFSSVNKNLQLIIKIGIQNAINDKMET